MEIRRYKPFRILDQDIKLKNKLRTKYITTNSLRNTKIDIILPTYNRFELLNKAIESLKNSYTKDGQYIYVMMVVLMKLVKYMEAMLISKIQELNTST